MSIFGMELNPLGIIFQVQLNFLYENMCISYTFLHQKIRLKSKQVGLFCVSLISPKGVYGSCTALTLYIYSLSQLSYIHADRISGITRVLYTFILHIQIYVFKCISVALIYVLINDVTRNVTHSPWITQHSYTYI